MQSKKDLLIQVKRELQYSRHEIKTCINISNVALDMTDLTLALSEVSERNIIQSASQYKHRNSKIGQELDESKKMTIWPQGSTQSLREGYYEK